MIAKPLACRTTRRFLPVVLALTVAGCSGGSGGPTSPTGPSEGPTAVLSTQWGEVVVETNGYPVDFDRALQSVIVGYDRGRSQVGSRIDGIRLDGYRLTVMPADWGLNGEHVRAAREIRMRAGVENVLEHELQHMFAWELDRFSDCKTYQDHTPGYDLLCRRHS
jgi:hypothetical protein